MNSAFTNIHVRKNNGDLVTFEPQKLQDALYRTGASDQEIGSVLREVQRQAYDGISTKKIYQIAYKILYRNNHRSAGRYRLKKALQQMGPTGYPFEHFVSRLLEAQGYRVETSKVVQGLCVTHEVDVVGRGKGKILMVECKFHRSESAKNDVKISLYVHSRMQDIKAQLAANNQLQGVSFEPMLVTNTRFTEDAEKYGVCAGLTLISWDFPRGNSLKEMIDRSGFHPITSLKALTQKEKELLMAEGTVLCKEIAKNPEKLTPLHIPHKRAQKILMEAKAML
ncbi:MAG: ATPase [Bacteroidetes bacterium]|nr:MAG: ATPase [Bacteroidota bacterium]